MVGLITHIMKKLTIPDVMKENIIKEIRRNDDSKAL